MTPPQPVGRAAKTGFAAALSLSLALPLVYAPSYAFELEKAQQQITGEIAEEKISSSLTEAEGDVTVFVQLKGAGAYASTQPQAVLEGKAKPVNAQARVQAITRQVQSQAQQLRAQTDGEILYTTHNALRGVALKADAATLESLASRSDVEKIYPIIAKERFNGGTAIDTRAIDTWVQTGKTGKDVTIAVIDSGIDYTHAAFGGPGTEEAFYRAKESKTMIDGLYDPEKYVGGYDLVGDDYTGSNDPQPDESPLDCEIDGHGTHVAGSAAGYAVEADGSTFKGDYTSLKAEDVMGMKIGPGAAPEAKLVGLRVFGCDGSTKMTAKALDSVLDPNNDGDFSDRADIVNLSLGSDFAAHDDPDNVVIDYLYRQGILAVAAAGNASRSDGVGDTYSISGSPANTIPAIAVANSLGSYANGDKVEVLGPDNLVGDLIGDYSGSFRWSEATEEQLMGEVVMAPEDNRYACDPFPEGTDFGGKWVWIDWAENVEGDFPCGSAVRFDHIEAAGGGGVVLASKVRQESAGIAGNATIPGVRLNVDSVEKVLSAAQAGTLKLRLDGKWIGSATFESQALDTLNPSSGRGAFGAHGFTKPDVAAPGTAIKSAGVALGSDPTVMGGTSMAAPHVAGVAALVRESNRSYSPAQIKAAVMNTATHDVRTDDGKHVFSVERVGSGRIDALAAVGADVLVYNSTRPEQVSVSFGVAEVPANDRVTLTRKVTVENTSKRARTFNLSLAESSSVTGVTLSVPQTVTVAPGSKSEVTITAVLEGNKLAKDRDPAAMETQLDTARHYLATASARLLVQDGAEQLRVPVQIAARPVAQMKVDASSLHFALGASATTVRLEGADLNQGGYRSLLGAFQLGAESPRISTGLLANPSSQLADIQYVGANSSAPLAVARGGELTDGYLNFGVSSWSNWVSHNRTWSYTIDLDTNNDGVADYYVSASRIPGLDLSYANLYRVVDGRGRLIGSEPINGTDGDVDTTQLWSNAAVFPVSLKDLGLTEDEAEQLRYKVTGTTRYHDGIIDETAWIKYNPYNPDLYFGSEQRVGTSLFVDAPDNALTAYRADSTTEAKALFLHMHNATGDLSGIRAGMKGERAEVIKVTGLKVVEEKTPGFTDVSNNHLFYREISWLSARRITTGYADGTFRPNASVERAAMAAFFYRMAGYPQFTAPSESPFKDVPTDHPFYKEITWMHSQGITTGWSDGTFRPHEPVNRDAMAAFFYRFAGQPVFAAPAASPFQDVTPEAAFYREITWLASQKVTTGWADGTFRPVQPIERGAMAAFIYRYDQNVLSR